MIHCKISMSTKKNSNGGTEQQEQHKTGRKQVASVNPTLSIIVLYVLM